MTTTIHIGDCRDVMAAMEPASIDAIVTDPPYGLEFMGKDWDKLGAVVEHPDDGEGPWGRQNRVRYGKSAKSMQSWHEAWAREAFRVLKPGGLILDPFTGSGSTGCAAVLEGFNFIGIDQDAEYAAIAERRIAYWSGVAAEPAQLRMEFGE